MDAKPQRPLRALRVQDENIPPSFAITKTLHQRNKSSPALSALVHGHAIQPGLRRTAFGDVSNTSRNLQTLKDDSLLATKAACAAVTGALKENVKPAAAAKAQLGQESGKHTAISRPAQRPLSVAGLKGILGSITRGNTSTNTRQPTEEGVTHLSQQLANTRKAVVKRSTTVFMEKASTTAVEPLRIAAPEAQLNTSNVTRKLAPRHAKSQPHIRPEPLPLQNYIKPVDSDSVLTLKTEPFSATSDLPAPIHSSLAHGHHASDKYILPDFSAPQTDQHQFQPYSAHPQFEDDIDYLPVLEPVHIPSHYGYKENVQIQVVPVPDTQEYWDEDEDEDFYEDEGYTTARSLRSRSDNTTQGATMILAPRVTAKVEREIEAARLYVQVTKTEDDIADEAYDTSMVAEYGDEIFQYMRELEERMRPNPHYMENQQEVQWSMRGVLMDWLVQVHHRFTLLPETLFLCVNYIDRFLSCKVVSLGKLQLVGATAIFVAAKYEEINCPSVQEIVYMVDGGYTVDEILKAERFMLSMLQFELGWPGPMSFLRRISKADDYDLETRTLAKYFLEVGVVDERFVGVVPSYWAAGAHCLARLMLRKGDWSPAHVYYSNYTYSQLRPLLAVMVECCENPQQHHSAVYEKYSDKRYKRASLFVETEMAKDFQLPSLRRESSVSNRKKSGGWRRTACVDDIGKCGRLS